MHKTPLKPAFAAAFSPDGAALFTTSNRRVSRFDLTSRQGRPPRATARWSVGLAHPIGPLPTADGTRIIVANTLGVQHGLDATTGRIAWTSENHGKLAHGVMLADDSYLVATRAGRRIRLDARDGRVLEDRAPDDLGARNLQLRGGRVFAFGRPSPVGPGTPRDRLCRLHPATLTFEVLPVEPNWHADSHAISPDATRMTDLAYDTPEGAGAAVGGGKVCTLSLHALPGFERHAARTLGPADKPCAPPIWSHDGTWLAVPLHGGLSLLLRTEDVLAR